MKKRSAGNKSQPNKQPIPPNATSASQNSYKDNTKGQNSGTPFVQVATIFLSVLAFAAVSYQGYVARDTEKRQLRAYIGVVPGDVVEFLAGKQVIKLLRKNYGATPAYEVGFSTINATIGLLTDPLTPNGGCQYLEPQKTIDGYSSLFTMFPGVEMKYELTLNNIFNEDQINAVKAGHAFFIYHGTVCYKDAFDVTHYTNYCFYYTGNDMVAKNAEWCVVHNNSD